MTFLKTWLKEILIGISAAILIPYVIGIYNNIKTVPDIKTTNDRQDECIQDAIDRDASMKSRIDYLEIQHKIDSALYDKARNH